MWCWCCVCTCGVVCSVGCVCVYMWCCGGVWCGVVCTRKNSLCARSKRLRVYQQQARMLNTFLFLALSLSFFSLLSLFSLLSSLPPLLSSLLAIKHCGKNRSTNTAANFEAFECDLVHGRCTSVGSLPLPPPFSPSPPQKKEEGTFNHRNISGEESIFYYSLKLIPKKSPPGEITVITVLYSFQNNRAVTRQNCNYFRRDGMSQISCWRPWSKVSTEFGPLDALIRSTR